jgi:hypothetical protein
MISSQGDDQNAQGNQSNDFLIAVGKSLGLDDRSSGQTCHVSGCEPGDKDVDHLKVRVHLHDDKELHAAAAPQIGRDRPCEAVHVVDQRPDSKRVAGRRLIRTIAFGVLTGVVVGAAFAWHFYGDVHKTYMVDAGRVPSILVSTNPPSVMSVEPASKTSDRVPTQDQASLPTQDQAAPVLPPGQVSVALGSSPELKDQLESIVSDVAVVRRIVERLAAVQEQMALDVVTLQKSKQNANQTTSLLPHSPAVPVPLRKYAPNIARSDVVAHSPSVPVPSAPVRPPSAPH